MPRLSVHLIVLLACSLVFIMMVSTLRYPSKEDFSSSTSTTRRNISENSTTTKPMIRFAHLRKTTFGKGSNGFLTAKFEAVKIFGLGNQLFELISVLGIAHKLGRVPFIYEEDQLLMEKLQKLLPRYPQIVEHFRFTDTYLNDTVNVPWNNQLCCVYEDVNKLKNNNEESIYLDGRYFQSYKYFNHIKEDVRKMMTPNKRIRNRVARKFPAGQFIICTHIRRGDFNANDGLHFPSNSLFTMEATKHLLNKYKSHNPSAIVFGNDINWAKHLFYDVDNVQIMEGTIPEEDLYFSSQYCDAVLITAPSSTFAWWFGYLSKNSSMVYYHDMRSANEGVLKELNPGDFYPKEWVQLREVREIVDIVNR